MSERWLIVNADDLGRSPGVNRGIFAAHERGIVTSATLMVGFPAAVSAARELADFPRLGVGLHVTLSGARPLLPLDQVPSLVNADGDLPRRPDLDWQAEPAEIEREVRAQLARFRELTGRWPTHFDSHHHSHRVPRVTDVLVTLARELGVPVRRASSEVATRLVAAGVASTDSFVESFYGDGAQLAALLEILAGIGPGVTELMVHPGQVDDELRTGSTYLEDRERELAILTDPAVLAAVARHGLRLATFGEPWKS
ncbi:MAG: carbohydrate deacetylase [Thermoanaerobaculia bacterium]|nr:carbohydrate deacetylase [Thermoanaerobaculia bacterium]